MTEACHVNGVRLHLWVLVMDLTTRKVGVLTSILDCRLDSQQLVCDFFALLSGLVLPLFMFFGKDAFGVIPGVDEFTLLKDDPSVCVLLVFREGVAVKSTKNLVDGLWGFLSVLEGELHLHTERARLLNAVEHFLDVTCPQKSPKNHLPFTLRRTGSMKT